MINNGAVIVSLATSLDDSPTPQRARRLRSRIPSDICLIARLPTTAFLQREAESNAARVLEDQLRLSPSAPSSPKLSLHSRRGSDAGSLVSDPESNSPISRRLSFAWPESSKKKGAWKKPEPFEVFRAIERKDITYLMEVRDRDFQQLVCRTGDTTPLLHAMRIGESHRDVAIILLGGFSRWINHLQDEDMLLPRTKTVLKALRANLKLAIDFGLQSSQSDLLASFLQTLIMSEGDHWVRAQVEKISLALRAGSHGKPVHTAEIACRAFTTRELGKAAMIATIEDYIGNATVDLLIMAAWLCVLGSIEGDSIPTWYFARDDRVYKAFTERLAERKQEINKRVGRRLRWQLQVLEVGLEGQNTTFRNKVDVLRSKLDEGEVP